MPSNRALIIAVACGSAHALSPAQTSRRAPLTATATREAPAQTSRRTLLTTTATGITTLVLSPATASAGSKLEDGLALPDGARQFNEFQGLKGEWTRFGERLKKTDIDDKEWEGVPLLLRRVYDAGDDMLFMAKGAFQRSYVQNISQGRHPLLATECEGVTPRPREADENPNFESTIRGTLMTHASPRRRPRAFIHHMRRSLQGQAGEGEEAREGLPAGREGRRPARPGQRPGCRHQGLRGDGALVVGLPRPHERRTPRLVGCLMFNQFNQHNLRRPS